jgi:hypothetical protein
VAELLKDRGRDGDRDRDRERDRDRDRDSSVEYDDSLTGGYRMYFIDVFLVILLIFFISLSPSSFPHLPLPLIILLIIPFIPFPFPTTLGRRTIRNSGNGADIVKDVEEALIDTAKEVRKGQRGIMKGVEKSGD